MRACITTTLALSMVGLFLFTSGCSEDPTSPTSSLSPPEAVVTVGSSGGILRTPTFELAIPQGAFSDSTELRVYLEEPDLSFGPAKTNHVYRVEGLPAGYSDRLTLRLKFPAARPDEVLMAVGEESFAQSKAAVKLGWRIHDAMSDTDWCVYTLTSPEGDAIQPGTPGISVPYRFSTVYGHSTYVTSAGHFKIRYIEAMMTAAQAIELGRHLEEAYSDFNNLDFSYDARTDWPVDVVVKFFGDADRDRYGFAHYSHWGDNYGWLEFNIQQIGDSESMRLAAGHEFFHLIQSLYDPRPPAEKVSGASDHYWLDEATAVWAEGLFTDEVNYVPAIRNGFELQPFVGMQAGAGGDTRTAQHHGYGMAALTKFVVDQLDASVLSEIYEQIALGMHSVDAVATGAGSAVSTWYEYFLENYITTPIYGLQRATLLEHRSGQMVIASASDSSASFNHEYPDLSGKIFTISLDYPEISAEAELQVQALGGHFVVTAFSFQEEGEYQFLGKGSYLLAIPGLRALTGTGHSILLLVTNTRAEPPTYSESTDMNLTLKILNQQNLPVFDTAQLSVRFHAFWENDNGSTWDTTDENLLIVAPNGTFNGTTFFTAWDYTSDSDVRYTGSFLVELDPYDLSLTRWEVSSYKEFPGDETYHFTSSRGGGIPLGHQESNRFDFGVSGPGTCGPGPVESVFAIQVNNGIVVKRLTRFECDENSHVDITLRIAEK